MADGFSTMIATSIRFMGDLAQNNTRDWFEDHKARFKAEIEAPLKLLADLFAEDLSRLTGRGHSGKVGRIYRDVRFSKDKSPYNTHVQAYWVPSGGSGPGWLFRIDATGAVLMTGLHDVDPDGLSRYRAAVDRDGDALQAALDEARGQGAEVISFGEALLKRVPRPYPADHRHGDLLRRRQIALGRSLSATALEAGALPGLTDTAALLLPFWRWCDHAVG